MILRFNLSDGSEWDLPYDFGQDREKQIAIDQFMKLFSDDIVDVELLEGWPVERDDPEPCDNMTDDDRQFLEDHLIGVFRECEFIGTLVARRLDINPANLPRLLQKYGLSHWVEKERKRLRKNKWAHKTY